MGSVAERITAYLTSGGLFNPELADHRAVSDLLIDSRAEIEWLRRENIALHSQLAAALAANQSAEFYRQRLGNGTLALRGEDGDE